jgi:hypothetical protein
MMHFARRGRIQDVGPLSTWSAESTLLPGVFSGDGEHVERAGARFRGHRDSDGALCTITAIASNLP